METKEETINQLNPDSAPRADAAQPTPTQPRRRHRNPDSRTRKTTVRLNDSELAELTAAATARTVTLGRFIAVSALAAARGDHAARDPQDRLDAAVQALRDARAQLARVGGNLNQVAFVLNAGGNVRQGELSDTLTAVRRAVATVDFTAHKMVTDGP